MNILNLTIRIILIVMLPVLVLASTIAMVVILMRSKKVGGYKRRIAMFFLGAYCLVHWVICEPDTFIGKSRPSSEIREKHDRWFAKVEKWL